MGRWRSHDTSKRVSAAFVRNQALGVALFSYDGGLFWGLNADWDAVPDLHDFAEALAVDFEALRKAAQG